MLTGRKLLRRLSRSSYMTEVHLGLYDHMQCHLTIAPDGRTMLGLVLRKIVAYLRHDLQRHVVARHQESVFLQMSSSLSLGPQLRSN